MNLHAFYNQTYIDDILLIRLSHQRDVTRYERNDDLCILYHHDSVIGYNLFHASLYIDDLKDGKIKITPSFVESLNHFLTLHHQDIVESDYDDHFKVGKVIAIENHPDSDHLHICQVDTGQEVLQIVCGAPNVALDQFVVVAMINAVMPSGLVIRPSSLRGVKSQGMLCSARELALENAPQVRGIMILDEEDYKVGDSFFK